MSLRNLPTSERVKTTLLLLALATILGLGLGSVFHKELRPAPPASAPPAHSQLVAVLEGVMAGNTTPAETARFKAWVEAGATRAGYAQVEPAVVNACASCHAPGGQFPPLTSYEDLRSLALEPATTGLGAWFEGRPLHFAVFPLLFFLATAGFLRRTAWPWRKVLLGGCALAVLLDAAQWWLRQGRPEASWAAWAASALLAAAMAALVAAVLVEVWRTGKT